MSELQGLVNRLAEALGGLDDSTHLIISRVGSDDFSGTEGSNRFVQFARSGTRLRAESVGDRYLLGPDRLNEGQQATLRRLGWEDPDESGNHWRQWDAPFPLRDAAALAVDTLHRVHGAVDVEQLKFDAAPNVLAALSGAGWVPDPQMLRLGYWDYDPDQTLTCPSCAWTGKAGDHQTQHRDVVDVSCPSCDRLLLVAVLPTLEETRAAAAAGNPRAVAGLSNIEGQAEADEVANALRLVDPAQLPELSGEELVIAWDVEGREPNLDQVLRHGDVELWREPAFYESYPRFEKVFAILHARYGTRFTGLLPTTPSETWLYGDRLASFGIVKTLNLSVSRGATSEGGLLEVLARTLAVRAGDLLAALPAPIAKVEIEDTDGTRWLSCGSPALVLVGTRGAEIVVAEPGIAWLGHAPILRVHVEHAVLPAGGHNLHDIAGAVTTVKETRLGLFQECAECGETCPPEWMFSRRLCQGCAERNHGVVF